MQPNVPLHVDERRPCGAILDRVGNWDILVTTTGFTSREVYEIREARQQDHRREFLTVGSMGHASVIAMGIAISKPSRAVWCIDGDGALLMHMGSMATVGQSGARQPQAHPHQQRRVTTASEGQPTKGFDVEFGKIASACGYRWVKQVKRGGGAEEGGGRDEGVWRGRAMLEVLVNKGARKNLGRPKTTPLQNKVELMGFLDG